MKKFSKIVLATASVLAVGSAAFNVLMAQPHAQASNLTLADVELFAAPCQAETIYDHKEDITIITVCDRETTMWDALMGIWCQSSGSGPCNVAFKPEQ